MQGNVRINQYAPLEDQQGMQIQDNDNGGPPQPGHLNNNWCQTHSFSVNLSLAGPNLVGAHIAIYGAFPAVPKA